MGSLDEWLATYASKDTQRTYYSNLKGFLHFVFEEGDVAELADTILEKENKEIMRDINRYFGHLKKGNPRTGRPYAPKTLGTKIIVIKIFMDENFREFPRGYWSRFTSRQRGANQSITQDIIPTSDDLRRITAQMKVYGKAFFLFMSAAGTRIGETSQIWLTDVEMEMDPPRVHLRATTTKNGLPRTVFFTGEAKEMIEEWLKVRDAWIIKNLKRSQNQFIKGERLGPDKEKRLFPWSKDNARYIWNTAVEKSQKATKDKNTNWMQMRPHTLRKRFRTQLGSVLPVDVVEVLMGHKIPMGMYVRFTLEELAEYYKQGEHVLYLSTDLLSLKRLERQMRDREAQIQALEHEVLLMKEKMGREMLRDESDESP